MAVRNTAAYLPDCVDSIIAQTFKDWELVAVNDHSDDGSKEILLDYAAKDKRIKVFDSIGHKLIPALRTAWQNASGILINRMDSDDLMPEYKLQVLHDNWAKYGKGYIVAGGTVHFVTDGMVGDGFRRYERWLNEVAAENRYEEDLYRECVLPSHCWLVHRDDLALAGAFDSDVYPEDYALCFRFFQAGIKVIGIDRILHFWRDRSDRISRTWACYRDNRYFDLKLMYFLLLHRVSERPLALWGAGRNGKGLAKRLEASGVDFRWFTSNIKKIGKDIYGHLLEPESNIERIRSPQIIIAVNSPGDRKEIAEMLSKWGKHPVDDYWFFT